MSAISPLSFRGACAAAFAATLLAGWHFTGSPLSGKASDTASGKTVAPENGKRGERAARNHGVPSHVRDTLAAIRASAPDQRMRSTIELASTMPLADLAEWLEKRWFDTGEGFDLTLFHKIAMKRWEAEDREGFLAWSLKDDPDGASQLIANWAKEDPALALAFLKAHPDTGLEIRTLSALAATAPKLALDHLCEMIKRGDGQQARNYLNGDLFRQIAQKDPAALEAALDTLPYGWQIQAEGALVSERLKESFTAEMEKLFARPDGWKLFESAMDGMRGLPDRILEELPNLPDSWKRNVCENSYRFMNQDNARRWLDLDLDGLGLDKRQQRNLRQNALQNLAFKNPAEALGLLGEFGLDQNVRQNLISNILANNPVMAQEKGEKLIAALGSEEDREIARKLVSMQQDSNGNPRGQITAPDDWLETVSAADTGNSASYLYMIRGWDKEKQAALSDGFQSMPEDKKLAVAKVIASGSSYGIDTPLQGDAIRYLVSQPAEPAAEAGKGPKEPYSYTRQADPVQAASRYAVELSSKDPDAAARWVQSLPTGDARQWASKNLATNWANYDPDAMQEWVNSLPAGERKEVEAHLKEQAKQ